MQTTIYKSTDRGEANFGWFRAKYSFSFGQWYNPQLLGFGALRVFNDSVIQPGKGFPEHPHDNMEVITVQLQGKLNHTDVSGTRVIQAGDVQVITAGSGVTHSDLNIGTEEAKQFQIWITPNKMNATPQSNIAHFRESERQNKWQTLASPYGDTSSKLNLLQDAWISRGVFDADNKSVYQIYKPNNGIYFFIIDGHISLKNESISTRDAIGISEATEVGIYVKEKSDILVVEVPLVS